MAAVLVLARLCKPSSELHTAKDWYRRTRCWRILLALPAPPVNDDRCYRIALSAAERAEAEYSRAMALAEERGMRPLIAHCHLGLGRLYRVSKREQAREHVTSAMTMFREMGMRFWLEKADAELQHLG